MPLETTMICVDNSEWMRNGDYTPTRFEAQHDAANMLCGVKTNQNPESTVGFVSMAGKGPEVMVSPTEDMGKLLGCLPTVEIAGHTSFVYAMQVAQLALKHRKNKKGQQRIVAFVGSPLADTEKEMENVGKKLKKNNVAVDIVLFGEIDDNNPKLEKFIEKVNSSNNSHLVVVPPGILPSDVLASSPIVHGDDGGGGAAAGGGSGGAAGGGGGGNFAEYGGVNPDLDPELAMALRVSMEEEAARQKKAAATEDGGEGAEGVEAAAAAPTTPAPAPAPAAAAAGAPEKADADAAMADEEDEDDLLAQALALSQQGAEAGNAAPPAAEEAEEVDEALQLALQMSMQAEEPAPAPAPASAPAPAVTPAATPAPAAASDVSAAFLDPAFVNTLLQGLPGVDPNDPKIKVVVQAAMESISSGDKKDEDKDKKDEDKK